MRKRKFYALRQLYSRWLTLTILLISIAIVALGCSSSDSTPPPPAPSTVTTTRDAKGVWFITGSEQDRLYDVFEALSLIHI